MSSCKEIINIKKISDYNYIGLNTKRLELINIVVKINPFDNYGIFETNPIFYFDDDNKISDFDVLTKNKLICIDRQSIMIIILNQINNNIFIYKSISFVRKRLGNILVDKSNSHLGIKYDKSYNSFQHVVDFYDFELNFKKSFVLGNEVDCNVSDIYLLNKELYIIFQEKIYLISAKYLELISVYNDIIYSKLKYQNFIFYNSSEIFIKERAKSHIYHYKLIEKELIFQGTKI